MSSNRRVVYIAHPLGSGPEREQNRRNAAKWVAWAARLGVAPVADWIILSGECDETPENRAAGLECDLSIVPRCDEVWLVGGRKTLGMALKAGRAIEFGIPVIDKTGDPGHRQDRSRAVASEGDRLMGHCPYSDPSYDGGSIL